MLLCSLHAKSSNCRKRLFNTKTLYTCQINDTLNTNFCMKSIFSNVRVICIHLNVTYIIIILSYNPHLSLPTAISQCLWWTMSSPLSSSHNRRRHHFHHDRRPQDISYTRLVPSSFVLVLVSSPWSSYISSARWKLFVC